MIAKNNPSCPPVFYGTRLMEISSVSTPDNWFWCPGPQNPADLLTRSGSTCDQINSVFWLNGSFLPQPWSSWPIKMCMSLPPHDLPSRTINLVATVPTNPSSDLIINLLECNQSLSKVISALTLIHKTCRTRRLNPIPTTTWNSIKTSILSFVLKCFSSAAETIISANKLKYLVIQSLDGVYHVSDHSFRSRIGVPLVC